MTIEPDDTADKEVERVARAMCKRDGLDPDTMVSSYAPPQAKRGFYLMPVESGMWPAWKEYIPLARVAIDELRPKSKIELVSAARPVPYANHPVPYANWMRDLRRIAHDLLRPGRDKQDDAQSIKDLRYLMEEQVNDAD
jgi:hypothetical protein